MRAISNVHTGRIWPAGRRFPPVPYTFGPAHRIVARFMKVHSGVATVAAATSKSANAHSGEFTRFRIRATFVCTL